MAGSCRPSSCRPKKLRGGEPDIVSEQILNPDKDAQASYTGLIFSPDGRRIYLSNVRGDIKVLAVGTDGKVTALHSLPLPQTALAERKAEIPAGLAVSPDGNGSMSPGNLIQPAAGSGHGDRENAAHHRGGSLPYEVVLAGNKAYVSNWGGRRPEAQSTTGPAGRGTTVRVDPVRHIANEGSVSVMDLRSGAVEKEIVVGLHACCHGAVARWTPLGGRQCGERHRQRHRHHPRCRSWKRFRCAGKPRICLAPARTRWPSIGPANSFIVCNGTQNAVAVVRFQPGKSRLTGLMPDGVVSREPSRCDPERNQLCVANVKGIGSGKRFAPGEKVELNSHQYRGTFR